MSHSKTQNVQNYIQDSIREKHYSDVEKIYSNISAERIPNSKHRSRKYYTSVGNTHHNNNNNNVLNKN